MRTRRAILCLAYCASFAAASLGQDAPPRIWVGNPVAPYLDIVGDDDASLPKAVRIVAAANGSFSGKAVVCSAGPIKAVQAKVGDLKTPDGKAVIPAGRVQVRYATGWLKGGWNVQSKAGSTFDVLEEQPPAEAIKPLPAPPGHDKYHPWVKAGRSYLPIWVTVAVPARTAAGEYAGRLAVSADGATWEVPIALTVHGYALPNAVEFRTWVETIQSPDTLALQYDVPLWSDKHWKLIEQSLRYGAMLANRTVYFPLICESNFGNAESAVRWVRQGPDKYAYDLSLVEKYLDLQIASQGKPRIVCFPIWDTFLEGGQFDGDIKYESPETRDQRLAYKGKGPEVTLLDPAGGKVEKLMLPKFSDPGAAALWSPLIQQIVAAMKKRGLEESLFFGVATDCVPDRACLDLVNQVVPNAKWVIHAHSYYGGKDKKANFQYAAFVWGVKGFCSGQQGWNNPTLLTQFLRNMDDHYPITTYRQACEVNLTGGQRGIGRVGLDYWPVIKDPRGRPSIRASHRYPKASWRNLNITDSLLAGGKDGPLGTARFEMLREGVQECEARIFIQTALDAGKLPAAVADSVRKVLPDRDEFLRAAAIVVGGGGRPWFSDANPPEPAYLGYAAAWQEQSDRLYKAAAAVAAVVPASQPARP